MAGKDPAPIKGFIDRMWRDEIVPSLVDYIRIPNKSPAFDPDWRERGHMGRAVDLMCDFARGRLRAIPGASLEVLRLPERTPLIVIDIPGRTANTVLLYGHLDKQPEMSGWAPGKGPWSPVIEGDRLYGRGGADDGYALFAALAAVLALEDQNIAHARCVIVIEASEESGSPDLPAYMEVLSSRLGAPDLVICLDSGCGDYERLWLTTSLRGLIGGVLRVEVLKEGVHSGDASGIVPSSFRILRQLLARLEDAETGAIAPAVFHDAIPEDRRLQARVAASVLGAEIYAKFPFVDAMKPAADDLTELVLNRTWRPALEVTGLEGAPPPGEAGNVLRPQTTARLSLRLPPGVDGEEASLALKRILETDPPYGAHVRFAPDTPGTGWNAPATPAWLSSALEDASQAAWGQPLAMMGEGGTIPFMAMLGRAFPAADFVVTGVLGPGANAHGPNEFLHLPTGARVTETVARILAAHGAHAVVRA